MSNQLAVQQVQSLSINDMGNVFVKSGFFADTRDQAQAIVKILAGQELGISPIASMTGLYIVKGKPSLGANLIAACIKNSGRYNYKVLRLDAEVCEIEFYEKFDAGEKFTKSGTSKFTIEDARKAGTQNIDKFPRNMLFARAMSNGAKWYCASIFAGGVYTPDELGATVQYDEAGDIKNVIDGEVKEPEPAKEQAHSREAVAEFPANTIIGAGPDGNLWHDFAGVNVSDMSIELASGETDKSGKKYIDLETEELQIAASTMATMVKTRKTPGGKPVSDADVEKYSRKLSAIKTILTNRQAALQSIGQEQLL